MTKKTKKTLWIAAGVLLVGLLVGWSVVRNRNKQKGTPVEMGEVATRRIEERVSASGRIFPVTEVAISSDVSGEIVELLVKEGDSVKVGQVLARIDPDSYESQVAQAQAGTNASRAQIARSQAQVEQLRAQRQQLEVAVTNARQNAERTRQLVGEGLLSQQDLETAESGLATAEANVQAADANIKAGQQGVLAAEFDVKASEAALGVQRTQLGRTNIVAPMTGVVSLLSVEQGERVVGTIQMTGTEMMRLADLSQMEVEVEVSENDIPRVTVGDPVDVEVDAYLDRDFAGRVTEISNSANNLVSAAGTRTLSTDQVTNFVVTIAIDPAGYADLVSPRRPYPFRPGMSAAVEILTSAEEQALAVPIASVTARERERPAGATAVPVSARASEELEEIVWVMTDADTVARRPVKTGIQDREFIQVTEGLAAGERVVTGPYAAVSRKLKSGDEVYQEEDEGASADEDDDADE